MLISCWGWSGKQEMGQGIAGLGLSWFGLAFLIEPAVEKAMKVVKPNLITDVYTVHKQVMFYFRTIRLYCVSCLYLFYYNSLLLYVV